MHTLEDLRAGRLAGVRRLDLSEGLETLPPEVYALADSLEVLNLSDNLLDHLPDDLSRMHRLRVIFCSGNRFTRLPDVLGRCAALEVVGFKANRIEHVPGEALPPKLRWLILTDNRIASLPAALGERPALQKLMLAGNRLDALPETLSRCSRLELLRIAANRFERLPDWLPRMPALAWLACAGNPLNHGAALAQPDAAPEIDWSALTLQQRLGEGASGVIHRAMQQGVGPVAVKLFKGAVTSDGLPESEMAACLAAGVAPGLIGAAGVVRGHPEGTHGLVMRLVGPAFRPLAGPPSLDSCSRDVYPDALRLRWGELLAMARSMAGALRHLHARGVLHGDFYAHNMLWDGAEGCLLGDFGAASPLPADASASAALQRTEVLAFGIWLHELLTRCEGDAPLVELHALAALHARCTQPDADARPSMAEVAGALRAET